MVVVVVLLLFSLNNHSTAIPLMLVFQRMYNVYCEGVLYKHNYQTCGRLVVSLPFDLSLSIYLSLSFSFLFKSFCRTARSLIDGGTIPSSAFCAPNIPGRQLAATTAGDVIASKSLLHMH